MFFFLLRNLSQLPNISYSLALATFHLSLSNPDLTGSADQYLQEALVHFPEVLLPLLGNYLPFFCRLENFF